MKNKFKKLKFDIEAFEKTVDHNQYRDYHADIHRLIDHKTKWVLSVDFNVVSKSGLTPLQIAFYEDLSRCGYTLDENDMNDYRAKLLRRVDINQTNLKKQNVLHHIVCFRDFIVGPLFEKLVALGENPNAQDQDGNTPFHIGMIGNSSGVGIDINLIESKWVDMFWDATIKNNLGRTPLFCAAANVNLKDFMGIEPLSTLKQLGWDPSEVDYNQNTPLHALALSLGQPSVTYADKNALYDYCLDLDDLDKYENIGVDIYAKNVDGYTFFELMNKEFVQEELYNRLYDKFYSYQQKIKLQDVLQDFAVESSPRKI